MEDVNTPGTYEFPVPIIFVKPASENQVIEPPVPVATIAATETPEHAVIVLFDTVGGGGVVLIVNSKLSVTDPQTPVGSLVVNVNVILPAEMSALDGE